MHCTGCIKYYVAKCAREHCYGEKQRLIITQETLQERVSTTLFAQYHPSCTFTFCLPDNTYNVADLSDHQSL